MQYHSTAELSLNLVCHDKKWKKSIKINIYSHIVDVNVMFWMPNSLTQYVTMRKIFNLFKQIQWTWHWWLLSCTQIFFHSFIFVVGFVFFLLSLSLFLIVLYVILFIIILFIPFCVLQNSCIMWMTTVEIHRANITHSEVVNYD